MTEVFAPTQPAPPPAAPVAAPARIEAHHVASASSEARIVGEYTTNQPGPIFVVVGGIHGNEPGGPEAVRRVLTGLRERQLPLRGRFVALAGNLDALRLKTRFINRDLNRRWFEADLRALMARDPATYSVEDRQQIELLKIFRDLESQSAGPLICLDLHSTSGDGAPFCAFADTLRNRRVAFALPIPMLLGLEETIDGAMLGYLSDLGHVAIVVEGGQHDAEWTPRFLESATWLCLAAAGNLTRREVPEYRHHYAQLASAAKGMPRFVEIRYRHQVTPDAQFRMKGGYVSFQPVRKGELLAHDRTGEVRASERGRVLMPLYQVQGEDGFFLSRDVRRVWLALSALLRTLRLDRLVPFLPGVRRHPERPDHFVVNPSVARFLVRDVFHLFGYRRVNTEAGRLVFSRRFPDFARRPTDSA